MIDGYAAVFYDGTPRTEFQLAPDMVERIMPKAFRGYRSADVFGLFNHDPNMILGRSSAKTLHLTVDRKGLHYSIDEADTRLYQDVEQWQARGELTGSSFGFRVTDERYKEEGDLLVREILGVELRDVGPVTYPAYDGTADGRSIRCIDVRNLPIGPSAAAEEVRSLYLAQRRVRDDVRVRARSVEIRHRIGS